MQITPRVIRLRDAPAYLGMDKNRFNNEVRPEIPEIKMGAKSVCFDRQDLDAWFEGFKDHNIKRKEHQLWDKKECRGYTSEMASGTLTNKSKEQAEFAKALEQAC